MLEDDDQRNGEDNDLNHPNHQREKFFFTAGYEFAEELIDVDFRTKTDQLHQGNRNLRNDQHVEDALHISLITFAKLLRKVFKGKIEADKQYQPANGFLQKSDYCLPVMCILLQRRVFLCTI